MKRNLYWKFRTGISKSGTRKVEGKPAVMKYVRLAVLLTFLAGILIANVIEEEQLNSFGIWNTYFIEKFKYAQIRPGDLFYYVLMERLPIMLLLLLLTVTSWGTIAGTVFLSWQSFAAGFLMAASVVSYGMKGILLMGVGFFPQYLIYVPLYITYVYLAAFFGGRTKEGWGKGTGHMREWILFLAMLILFLSIYVTGIFLESYVNPYLLKKILKIF